jgi:hypothetical protein
VTDSVPPTNDASREVARRMGKVADGFDQFDVLNAIIMMAVFTIGDLAERHAVDPEALCDEVSQNIRTAALYDWTHS